MSFRINKVPLSSAVLERQISLAWSETKRARELQAAAAEAWRNEEAHSQGIRAAWFEDQMNAALDVLSLRYPRLTEGSTS